MAKNQKFTTFRFIILESEVDPASRQGGCSRDETEQGVSFTIRDGQVIEFDRVSNTNVKKDFQLVEQLIADLPRCLSSMGEVIGKTEEVSEVCEYCLEPYHGHPAEARIINGKREVVLLHDGRSLVHKDPSQNSSFVVKQRTFKPKEQ
jgi:hypothetical protein